jgi:CRP/FNR family transcriptional regulator, cyclic AMP receptor protein
VTTETTSLDSQMAESHAALSRKGWLAAQPEEFRRQMIMMGRRRSLASGEVVALEGEDDARMYGILKGAIACSGSHGHDAPILSTVLFPGQWFGYGPQLGDLPRTLTFHAQAPSELLAFGNTELQKIRAVAPDLGERMAQLAVLQTNYAAAIVTEVLIPKSAQRIAAVLVRLANWSAPLTLLPVSQNDLAEMSNASRQTVSKALKKMEHSGLIVQHYGGIDVPNINALARWSDPGGA